MPRRGGPAAERRIGAVPIADGRDPQARVEAYLRDGMATVEGWLDRGSARIIVALDAIQQGIGVAGAAAEIGVHHGKLLILLHLLLRAGERSLAIDVFARQELNLDRSGRGNQGILRDNLVRAGGDPARLAVIEDSSLSVTAAAVLAGVGRVRLFSVDGGHSAEVVGHDLALAEASLAPGGVVILDDAFNDHWPGVMTGLAGFLLGGTAAIRPFAIGPNKVFLCDPALAERYRQGLGRALAALVAKEAALFGSPVVIFSDLPPVPSGAPLAARWQRARERLRRRLRSLGYRRA